MLSQQVSATSGATSEATMSVVSSVVTGTQGAGRGQKYGTASVTVLDDIGNPAVGVNVTGNFSGTWNESASTVTDANGIAQFITNTSASGGVSVSFCVSDVTGGLPLDTTASNGLCQ